MAASIPKVKSDHVRDSAFAPDGYRVLRFWTSDVLKIGWSFLGNHCGIGKHQ
jgi:very-short-patch-repair endonuclease